MQYTGTAASNTNDFILLMQCTVQHFKGCMALWPLKVILNLKTIVTFFH